MQINEAKIYHFGKLKERDFYFAPGINVIYGPNESGKSTLHAFMTAMLFGLDKGRGKAGELYQRYEPWHAPAYYSGALRFSVEGRPFYLERNFYHKEKKEILRNEADGEELSVAYGDLAMLLGGIGKEAFGNTYDIPQTGAQTGKECKDILAEYLSNAAEGGDGNTHVADALRILETKRKQLNLELRKEIEREQQEKRELQIESGLLERDIEVLKKQIADGGHMLSELKQKQDVWKRKKEQIHPEKAGEGKYLQEHKKEPEYQQEVTQKRDRTAGRIKPGIAWLVLIVISVAGILMNTRIHSILSYNDAVFIVIQGLFGSVGAICFLVSLLKRPRHAWNRQALDLSVDIQEEMPASDQEYYGGAAVAQAERMLGNLKDSLLEKETRHYNITEQLAELYGSGGKEDQIGLQKVRELQQDIAALELASKKIGDLAQTFCEDMKEGLNKEVSRLVSVVTAGTYDSVKVDSSGRLKVLTGGREVPPEALSRGAMEQIYFALRLSVGNVVSGEECMPIFLDEAMTMYDDQRLGQVLKVLAGMKNQIFLFTCQGREMQILGKLGITYHKIILE